MSFILIFWRAQTISKCNYCAWMWTRRIVWTLSKMLMGNEGVKIVIFLMAITLIFYNILTSRNFVRNTKNPVYLVVCLFFAWLTHTLIFFFKYHSRMTNQFFCLNSSSTRLLQIPPFCHWAVVDKLSCVQPASRSAANFRQFGCWSMTFRLIPMHDRCFLRFSHSSYACFLF